jgi:hypothetical protein
VDLVPTSAEAEEDLKRLGLVRVNQNSFESLKRLGVYLKSAGVLKTQRGRAFVTQEQVSYAIQQALARLTGEETLASGKKRPLKNKDAIELLRTVGYLAGQLTDVQRFVVEMEEIGSPSGTIPEPPARANQAFEAGKPVVPAGTTAVFAREAHFHTTTEAPKPATP